VQKPAKPVAGNIAHSAANFSPWFRKGADLGYQRVARRPPAVFTVSPLCYSVGATDPGPEAESRGHPVAA
jgi:hypothetical protein